MVINGKPAEGDGLKSTAFVGVGENLKDSITNRVAPFN